MNKLAFVATLLIASVASVANAATVRFKGAVNPLSVATAPTDPLGILSLPSTALEVQLTTNGAGAITGSYVVFQGVSYNFSSGNLTTAPTTNFNNLALLGTPGAIPATLSMNIPLGIAGDTQAALDTLINVPGGSFSITGTGFTYFGGVTAVPEPSSMLALVGLVSGIALRRRRSVQTV